MSIERVRFLKGIPFENTKQLRDLVEECRDKGQILPIGSHQISSDKLRDKTLKKEVIVRQNGSGLVHIPYEDKFDSNPISLLSSNESFSFIEEREDGVKCIFELLIFTKGTSPSRR